jgi:hypothetical protein
MRVQTVSPRYFRWFIAGIFLITLAYFAQTSNAQTSVGGVVFADNNSNGQRDNGEGGVPNVKVSASASGQLLNRTTGADGTYPAFVLPNGSAQIWVTVPAGCRATTAGSVAVANATPSSVNFGLSCGNQGSPAPSGGGQTTPPPTNGLVARYNFNEESGTATVDGIAGNNGQTQGNVQRIAGKNGNAVALFGGTVNMPATAQNSLGGGDLTIATWVKTSDSSGVKSILDKRETINAPDSTSKLVGYHLFLNNGQVGVQLADGNGNTALCGGASPSCTNYIGSNTWVADGQWHLLTVTIDRNNPQGLNIYVDGRLRNTLNPTNRQGSLANNAPIVLGGGFNVTLDDFLLYNRALSAGEVASLAGGGVVVVAPQPTVAPVATPRPSFNCNVVTQVPASECRFLVEFYISTGGQNWIRKDGWLQWEEVCAWFGVYCENGHVSEINLHGNQLGGTLPFGWGALTNLTKLRLNDNFIFGQIPNDMGNMPRLAWLFLNNNRLTGSIPTSLGNPMNFDLLVLNDNNLSGKIPESLGNLKNLQWLLLQNNQITGAIPLTIRDMPRLSSLDVSNNNIYGPLPRELGTLGSLQTLEVDNNAGMFGPIPKSFLLLPALRHFRYHATGLCEPREPDFAEWIGRFEERYVSRTGRPCPAGWTE